MAKKEKESNNLLMYVIPQKVTAFERAYEPLEQEEEGCIIYDDVELRRFFKAYICFDGDPLAAYIEALDLLGFHMIVTMAGEPAICVRLKTKNS